MTIQIQTFLNLFQKTILAFIKVLLLSKWKPEIKLSVQNKPCVILGNGPSFNHLYKYHKGFLENKDVICVNHFPTTSIFEEIKPEYFIVCAPEFWIEDTDEKVKLGKEKIFAALNNKVNWDLTILIPFSSKTDKKWQKQIEDNKYIKITFFNETGIEGWHKIIFWLWKKGLGMPRPHNILIPSIINAINLGYKEIYLWGADHNQFKEITVDNDNTALVNQRHFYDFDSSRPHHMTKMGRGKRKVHEILYKFMIAFKSYHEIRDYADSRNVKVFNMTPDSLIDAFERLNIDQL